jgi:hypothetical protein
MASIAKEGQATSGMCPNPSLLRTLGELERIYAAVAPNFRLDKHPHPRITVQTRGRSRSVLGWYWRNAWHPAEDDGFSGVDEITLAAETLNRPLNDVVATLLHEMVHHVCRWEGITDVSGKGNYHNGKFKRRAEAAGMLAGEKRRHVGWSDVRPGRALQQIIDALQLDATAFGLARIERKSVSRPVVSRWVCRCPNPQVVWSQRKEPLMAVCIWCLRNQLPEDVQDAVLGALDRVQFTTVRHEGARTTLALPVKG